MFWVTEYLDDLEADFIAIYRVDDMLTMPSAKFFRLAERLPAYRGVIRARAMDEHEKQQGTSSTTTTATTSAAAKRAARNIKPSAAQQRINMKKYGGETNAVKSNTPSYLHERLKEATR